MHAWYHTHTNQLWPTALHPLTHKLVNIKEIVLLMPGHVTLVANTRQALRVLVLEQKHGPGITASSRVLRRYNIEQARAFAEQAQIQRGKSVCIGRNPEGKAFTRRKQQIYLYSPDQDLSNAPTRLQNTHQWAIQLRLGWVWQKCLCSLRTSATGTGV